KPVGSDLLTRAKEVACSLHDKGRRLHFDEMCSAQLIRFIDWMERIAKAHQPGNPAGDVELVSDHAGDAPTHRFSADNEWPRRLERIDSGDVLGFERFRPWGRPLAGGGAARSHIGEFKARDAQAG